MLSSTRYFQLTPDILMEYNYTTIGVVTEDAESGDVSDKVIDLRGRDKINVLYNGFDSSTYFYVDESDKNDGIYANQSNFVTPLNKSCSKFIRYNRYDKNSKKYVKYENSSIDVKPYSNNLIEDSDESDSDVINISNDFDIVFDKLKFHFTSRNFMGEYNGLIIQAYVYTNAKRKVELMSFMLSRFDDLRLNAEPMLVNQKMYTTYINAKIVSTECLLYNGKFNDNLNTDELLTLFVNGDNEKLLKNTPIVFDVYGVKNSYDIGNYEAYTCERINSISVPSKDSYDGISVDITEATDGDYYVIRPNVEGTGYGSFSDFINSLTETPESYIILHELSLTEIYISSNNQMKSDITHVEHYMINAMKDGNGEYEMNEKLNDDFLYRPICKHSNLFAFTITDTLKIVDTYSNTTIVKKSSLTNSTNPNKYGKKMNKIYLGETPVQVNVYNKRTKIGDEDVDAITFSTNPSVITVANGNGGDGGVKIETKEIGITAFCESTNIRIIATDVLK